MIVDVGSTPVLVLCVYFTQWARPGGPRPMDGDVSMTMTRNSSYQAGHGQRVPSEQLEIRKGPVRQGDQTCIYPDIAAFGHPNSLVQTHPYVPTFTRSQRNSTDCEASDSPMSPSDTQMSQVATDG